MVWGCVNVNINPTFTSEQIVAPLLDFAVEEPLHGHLIPGRFFEILAQYFDGEKKAVAHVDDAVFQPVKLDFMAFLINPVQHL